MLPPFFEQLQTLVIAELERRAPAKSGRGAIVAQAMRYSLFAPAKRVRPIVTLLAAELYGGNTARALVPAAAVELVHTGSLILDDLPCMDNATMRRGQPANHRVHGEAVAILAAVALVNAGFRTLAEDEGLDPALRAELACLLATAIGSEGVIAGQAVDLLSAEAPIDFATLEYIHSRKTGALFIAAARAGALTAGARDWKVSALEAYAKNLGLAFQIVDDLLDVEGDPALTGKDHRADAKKTTFVSFSGVAGARQLARELADTAIAALEPFGGRAARLRMIAEFVVSRGT